MKIRSCFDAALSFPNLSKGPEFALRCAAARAITAFSFVIISILGAVWAGPHSVDFSPVAPVEVSGVAVAAAAPAPGISRLSLPECVAIAISRSAEVEGVATRFEAARLRAESTRVRRLPRPGVSASTRRSSGGSVDSVTLSLDFDIDHDGMVADEARAAEIEAASLHLADLAARNRAADAAVGLYVDALTASATAKVAAGALESARSFLGRMQKSFDLKVVTPLDLLQARAYHSAELYRSELAVSGKRKAFGALNTALGLPWGQSVELLEITPPETLPPLDDPGSVVSLAFSGRADLRQAENLLSVNRLRLSAAAKARRTRVSLFGASGWSGLDGDFDARPWNTGIRGTNDTFNGALSVEIQRSGSSGDPFVPGSGAEETGLSFRYVHNTGLEREIALSAAGSEVRRQELALRDLRDSVVEGVNSLILDIGVEQARERSLTVNLEAKTEEKRKKAKEFDLGLETAEELLDVSSELVAAETDLTLARYRVLRRLYLLVREVYAFDRNWLYPPGSVSISNHGGKSETPSKVQHDIPVKKVEK